MSGTGGKGKQISVIIAGATGNVGGELVSRLVSHPDVSRVVALTRHTIPVNRWNSVFPHLHTGDALRYLSVVPVDWEKLMADLANIPMSYVKDGRWRQQDVETERERYRRREQRRELAGYKSTTLTAGGIPTGYVRYEPRTATALHDNVRASKADGTGATAEKLQSSQEFLRLLLQQSFYNSVFSGHHVAINCLGTTHLVSSSKVVQVDYELSLAFAKCVRLFNCMTHAEPSEDEERLLVESTSRELNSVLWGEIYSACYGKGEEDAAVADIKTASAQNSNNNMHSNSTNLGGKGKEAAHFLSRGGVATLRNFTQMSVRSSSPYSPVPYLRAHGRRDRDLLQMFNRVDTTAARRRWQPNQTFTRTSSASIMVGAPSVVDMQRGLLARLARLWRGWPRAAGGSGSADAAKAQSDKAEDEMELVARHRAELFLRRDVVKIFESANITIWRPGVLTRAKPRFFDYVFSLFERPVDAERLAECITDDIIEDFYNPEMMKANQMATGSVKIINGKSVARRVMMKKLEDGLNRQDSEPHRY